jgi:hypothetical protein
MGLTRKLARGRGRPEARLVSFVHCPDCKRAYNLVGQPACPHCGVRAGAPADPTDDIIVAADQLARAVARATPAQLAAAELTLLARTRTLALPSPDRPDFSAPPSMLRAVRTALLPAAEPEPRRGARELLAEIGARALAATQSIAQRLPSPQAALSRARSLFATW